MNPPFARSWVRSSGVALALGLSAPTPPARPQEPEGVAALRVHYAAAERELRARDLSGLTEDQRASRARLLEVLHSYWQRGEFGRNTRHPGARIPYFVDDEGRRCAVARLLDADGEGDLVARIASTRNHAWIPELADDRDLADWLASAGISLAEAARIQAPGMGPSPPSTETWFWALPPPDSGASPTPTSDAGAPATSPEALAGPPTARGAGRGIPPTFAEEDWWTWWEMNRFEFLRPHRFRPWTAPITGGGDAFPEGLVERERRRAVEVVAPLVDRGDAQVRAAAAIALGRIGGREALSPLRRLLRDPNAGVRCCAILALGATGVEEAIPPLLRLAAEGSDTGRDRVSYLARPLALVALGIGRTRGLPGRIDDVVAGLGRLELRADDPLLATGILLYHALAPSKRTEPAVLALAADEEAPLSLRCRAVESLRSSTSPEAFSLLLRVLAGAHLDLRRSAALALGEFPNDLALPRLQTAYELEKEPLARAFLLLSVARRGGPVARAFLLDAFESSPKALRPWCALALGVFACEGRDPSVAEAIRAAFRVERNHDARGAYLLASGIARDREALPMLREALSESKSARIRTCAALALSLVGGPEARDALVGRLAEEHCPPTRASIAQAIGFLGDPRDSGILLDALAEIRDPAEQASLALGIGFHGTLASLQGLFRFVEEPGTQTTARAGAVDSLGLMLGEPPSLALGAVTRSSNFAVFPAWITELSRFTL